MVAAAARLVGECSSPSRRSAVFAQTFSVVAHRRATEFPQAIVTANLKDFPSAALAPYNVEALHPDEFLLGLVDLAPGVMIQVIAEQAAALRNPPHTLAMLLDTLRNNGLARTVARLRELSEK